MNQEMLNQLPTWPQRQDGVDTQMADLQIIANRLGLYDAADAIGQLMPRLPEINHKCSLPMTNFCVIDCGDCGDCDDCIYAKAGMRKETCR